MLYDTYIQVQVARITTKLNNKPKQVIVLQYHLANARVYIAVFSLGADHLFRRLVHLFPSLLKLTGRSFEEFIVAHISNQLVHGFLSIHAGFRCKGFGLEHGGFLGEGLEGFLSLCQVKGNRAHCLGEPGLITTIGGTGVGRLAHRTGSGDTPVVGRNSTELSLTSVSVTLGNVAVLLAKFQVVLSRDGGGG